ncbi:histone H2B-like [Tiliqua scincoides]|uniref:histone H2B-like n=1 Tax=Tiliqua scincoides TaxID=71010 RepID=UPI0034636788
MAAKQRVKKKGKTLKKNKVQRKHQKAKQKQKFQARKLKKTQSHLGRKAKQTSRAKAASREQKKICSPRLFASKILRQMPKVRMEAKARGLVKTLLTDLYNHVATEVETLSQKNDPSSISCADVQNFLKDAMAKELAKHTADSTSTTPTANNTTTTTTTTTTNSA